MKINKNCKSVPVSDDFSISLTIENLTKKIQLTFIDSFKNQKETENTEFFNYDSSKSYEKSPSTSLVFNRTEQNLNKITLPKLPEIDQAHNCFIITENESLIAHCKVDDLGSFGTSKFKNEELINIEFNQNLPSIEFPSNLTIESLDSFYLRCYQAAATLPVLVYISKINNIDLKCIESCFASLLNIYNQVTVDSDFDRSLVSEKVNLFIEFFRICTKRLEQSGVIFKNINLKTNFRFTYNKDFVVCPDEMVEIFT